FLVGRAGVASPESLAFLDELQPPATKSASTANPAAVRCRRSILASRVTDGLQAHAQRASARKYSRRIDCRPACMSCMAQFGPPGVSAAHPACKWSLVSMPKDALGSSWRFSRSSAAEGRSSGQAAVLGANGPPSRLHLHARQMKHDDPQGETPRAATSARTSLVLPDRLCAAVLRGLDQVAGGLIAVGVSANLVTGSCIALGMGAGILLAFGQFGLATMAMVVASLGDAVDGLVARKSRSASVAGALLDA